MAEPHVVALVDPVEMTRPLTDLYPDSKVTTTCMCGQVIHGPAGLTAEGNFVHPDGCPPPEPPRGMLL